ncbi:hypothetical protein JCM5296_000015 [Sporobolomyces johnsonii]
MLSSPLRRCLLTQKVLPKDLMIQLKLTRLPPAPPSSSARLVLTPSSVLHPRFSLATHGKGAWVSCWRDAVDTLSKKGSYKRLNSAAILPPTTTSKIHSQLARRLAQEAVMLAERAKSWPAGNASQCPVRRLSRAQWAEDRGRLGQGSEEEGWEVQAVLDLAGVNEGEGGRMSSLLPLPGDRSIPLYRLSRFVDGILLPPPSSSSDSLAPSSSSPAESDPATSTKSDAARLLEELKASLDDMIALFDRRRRRLAPETTATPDATNWNDDDLYLIYAPRLSFPSSRTPSTPPLSNSSVPHPSSLSTTVSPPPILAEQQARMAEDVVHLLVALWRCRSWVGEGWEEE